LHQRKHSPRCEYHQKNEYSKATGYNPHSENKTPGQVPNGIPQRSAIAFNVVLYLLQIRWCKPELNKASSVTSILSSPHFLTGDGTRNHTDELYSIPAETVSLILETTVSQKVLTVKFRKPKSLYNSPLSCLIRIGDS
jgi:hypothetical protein